MGTPQAIIDTIQWLCDQNPLAAVVEFEQIVTGSNNNDNDNKKTTEYNMRDTNQDLTDIKDTKDIKDIKDSQDTKDSQDIKDKDIKDKVDDRSKDEDDDVESYLFITQVLFKQSEQNKQKQKPHIPLYCNRDYVENVSIVFTFSNLYSSQLNLGFEELKLLCMKLANCTATRSRKKDGCHFWLSMTSESQMYNALVEIGLFEPFNPSNKYKQFVSTDKTRIHMRSVVPWTPKKHIETLEEAQTQTQTPVCDHASNSLSTRLSQFLYCLMPF